MPVAAGPTKNIAKCIASYCTSFKHEHPLLLKFLAMPAPCHLQAKHVPSADFLLAVHARCISSEATEETRRGSCRSLTSLDTTPWWICIYYINVYIYIYPDGFI